VAVGKVSAQGVPGNNTNSNTINNQTSKQATKYLQKAQGAQQSQSGVKHSQAPPAQKGVGVVDTSRPQVVNKH